MMVLQGLPGGALGQCAHVLVLGLGCRRNIDFGLPRVLLPWPAMAEPVPDPSPRTGASGKWVVFLVFGGALLMWLSVFLLGLRERRVRSRGGAEVVTTAPQIRVWLHSLPEHWSKVTRVEGQG